ncbi:hypothetical protein AB4342_02955 [Vibrio breoganii]|uniref:hypothetical protein n=1 Tax=Vibrio breoganii TaxID=553239 RepID=UPI001F5387AC|nr:hypothetical protein [Vibrio breoganii]
MLDFHTLREGIEGECRPKEGAPIAVPLIADPSGLKGHFVFDSVYADEYAVGYTCTVQHDTEETNRSGFEIYQSINNIVVEPGRTTRVEF